MKAFSKVLPLKIPPSPHGDGGLYRAMVSTGRCSTRQEDALSWGDIVEGTG